MFGNLLSYIKDKKTKRQKDKKTKRQKHKKTKRQKDKRQKEKGRQDKKTKRRKDEEMKRLKTFIMLDDILLIMDIGTNFWKGSVDEILCKNCFACYCLSSFIASA